MTATPTPDDGAALLSSIIECLLRAQRALEPIITTRLAIEGFPKDATAIGEARVAVDAAVEAWNTRSPAPVSGEAARVKELEGVLRYIIEYGERSGLKRVQQVCDMTLKGMDMSPLRQEPTQHCAEAGREGLPITKPND